MILKLQQTDRKYSCDLLIIVIVTIVMMTHTIIVYLKMSDNVIVLKLRKL